MAPLNTLVNVVFFSLDDANPRFQSRLYPSKFKGTLKTINGYFLASKFPHYKSKKVRKEILKFDHLDSYHSHVIELLKSRFISVISTLDKWIIATLLWSSISIGRKKYYWSWNNIKKSIPLRDLVFNYRFREYFQLQHFYKKKKKKQISIIH